jgi:hypothetical protein
MVIEAWVLQHYLAEWKRGAGQTLLLWCPWRTQHHIPTAKLKSGVASKSPTVHTKLMSGSSHGWQKHPSI